MPFWSGFKTEGEGKELRALSAYRVANKPGEQGVGTWLELGNQKFDLCYLENESFNH